MRAVFWSCERGSWPYDAIVVAIVLFVLLTPRQWFHDQASRAKPSAAGIQLVAEDGFAHTETYRLDPRLFPAPHSATKPGPELERETHEILGRSERDLKGRTFQIKRIAAVRGNNGELLYYEVEVKR